MTNWWNDLRIGVRLAVGGGRTSLARFLLSTVGIGIAVMVLLLASSVGTVIDAREQRGAALSTVSEPVAGIAPLHIRFDSTNFRGHQIQVKYLHATGATSPKPPGVTALPADGEIVVSPKMADLLATRENGTLRDWFPQRVIEVLDPSVVRDPADLTVYTWSDAAIIRDGNPPVYAFGVSSSSGDLDPGLLLLMLLGLTALLVPVFIFVASSTRIAGAERDRRLSALRLVGADNRQVRRIAAAESLVSAIAGLLLGGGVFLLARSFAESIRLQGVGVYATDIRPAWYLLVLVIVAVPVLAVLTAQFASRRTIIEPLGVVRFSKPVKRRAWWRFAMIGVGVALLLWHGGAESYQEQYAYSVATGAALLLIGVPVLLPWLVERTVSGLRGGPSSWQLAIRRLQLDSGTSARVVGGVAAVLTGAVALQCFLFGLRENFSGPEEFTGPYVIDQSAYVAGGREVAAEAAGTLRAVAGIERVTAVDRFSFRFDDDMIGQIAIIDCPGIRALTGLDGCVDGDVLSHRESDQPRAFAPGRQLRFEDYRGGADPTTVATWSVPASSKELPSRDGFVADLIVTPGAIRGVTLPEGYLELRLTLSPEQPAALDRAVTALVPYGWQVTLRPWSYYGSPDDERTATLTTIRKGLLVGAVFTLMLAGVSLLVLALEHIRERRRPLAVLAASGVPTGAIARSLLWQIVVPIGLGVVVAVVTGFGLAALMLRLAQRDLVVDWPVVGVMSGTAVVMGLLVTVVTLPFLRGAMRLTSLRTE